jgi:transposase
LFHDHAEYAARFQAVVDKRFANRLAPYRRGILARVRWPTHTGQLEGINNRIKVMKRMAYGYRDSAFFLLTIRAAFHGNP